MADKRLTIGLSARLLARIEDYRRRQPQIPTLAETIRRLIERGLDREKV